MLACKTLAQFCVFWSNITYELNDRIISYANLLQRVRYITLKINSQSIQHSEKNGGKWQVKLIHSNLQAEA